MPSLKFPKTRFVWSAFRGRCRRRVLTGLLLMIVAAVYGGFAGQRVGRRGADDRGPDQPIVRLARSMTTSPTHMRAIHPANNRELYLVTVISDQQDIMFGQTLLILRMILSLTIGGLGVVLVAGGSVEWEVRSEALRTRG